MNKNRRSKGSVNAQGDKDGGRFAPGERAKEQNLSSPLLTEAHVPQRMGKADWRKACSLDPTTWYKMWRIDRNSGSAQEHWPTQEIDQNNKTILKDGSFGPEHKSTLVDTAKQVRGLAQSQPQGSRLDNDLIFDLHDDTLDAYASNAVLGEWDMSLLNEVQRGNIEIDKWGMMPQTIKMCAPLYHADSEEREDPIVDDNGDEIGTVVAARMVIPEEDEQSWRAFCYVEQWFTPIKKLGIDPYEGRFLSDVYYEQSKQNDTALTK